MDLGQYWEQIVAIGTPAIGVIIIGAVKFIKNKLASSVVTNATTKIRTEIGEDNFTALTGVVKNYGVTKAIQVGKQLQNDVEELKTIIPLLKGLILNQLSLGVYDDNPELKETLEKLTNG